jgi:hypothetical protein
MKLPNKNTNNIFNMGSHTMKLKHLMVFSVVASVLAIPALADKDKKKVNEEFSKEKPEKVQIKFHEKKGEVEKKYEVDEGTEHNDHHGKKAKQKPLPPGLQKKVERGGELPPGWQTKVKAGEVLDEQVYAKGKVIKPVDKKGDELIRVEDKILKVHKKTREVREIIDAIDAINE